MNWRQLESIDRKTVQRSHMDRFVAMIVGEPSLLSSHEKHNRCSRSLLLRCLFLATKHDYERWLSFFRYLGDLGVVPSGRDGESWMAHPFTTVSASRYKYYCRTRLPSMLTALDGPPFWLNRIIGCKTGRLDVRCWTIWKVIDKTPTASSKKKFMYCSF